MGKERKGQRVLEGRRLRELACVLPTTAHQRKVTKRMVQPPSHETPSNDVLLTTFEPSGGSRREGLAAWVKMSRRREYGQLAIDLAEGGRGGEDNGRRGGR